MKKILYLFILILYVWGIYFLVKRPVEPFVSGKCPTTLIKDGNKFFIYDPSLAKVPGVNPIQFNDLDEYREYIEWQRKSNLNCPILHLEKVYTAEGSQMYEIRQNFLEAEECGNQPQIVPNIFIPHDYKNDTSFLPDAFSLALT
jgi:hypothetical protein